MKKRKNLVYAKNAMFTVITLLLMVVAVIAVANLHGVETSTFAKTVGLTP